MPPKRLAYAQKLREAFTETSSFTVVERWATETIEHLERLSKNAAAKRVAIVEKETYSLANAENTPEQVVSILQAFQDVCHIIFNDAQLIRTVISVRIPEIKEEDNLGVAVQYSVLRMIDEIQCRTLGTVFSGGGGGKEGSCAGVQTPFGVNALNDYFTARSEVEGKLLGESNKQEDDNKANSEIDKKSPSLFLKLRQVDVDALLKVEVATTLLATNLRFFVNAYALNWKKMIEPRTAGDRMVS